jgi:hypothetical protein
VRTSKLRQLSPLSTRHLQSPSRSHHPTHTTTDHYLSDTPLAPRPPLREGWAPCGRHPYPDTRKGLRPARGARREGGLRGTPTGMGSGALSRLAELPAVHETGHQDRTSGGGQLRVTDGGPLKASVSYGPSGLREYQIDAPQEPPSRSRADHRPRDGPRSGGGSGEPTPSTPGGSFPSARNGRTESAVTPGSLVLAWPYLCGSRGDLR